MSSLIEVLKQIQERDDLDSRTEARTVFAQESGAFEAEMAAVFPLGYEAVRELAWKRQVLAEYWMNQWVGADPKWHGDWGKMLRSGVRDIYAGWEPPMSEQIEDDDSPIDAALLQLDGTVKIGRNQFPAWQDGAGVVHYETKTGMKLATERVRKSFRQN